MEAKLSDENEKAAALSDNDWQNRKLCSDGNCIGVIGAGGRCKECGKEYEGSLPTGSSFDKEDLPPEEEKPPEAAEPVKIEEAPADDNWEDRKLCSDGSCIGVIGTDGRCKECGKPSEG